MDAFDAGAYAHVLEADVPRNLKVVLWGPLHTKQLGFDDWTYQDGGETGFVYHSAARAVKMGLATATLIVVRRLEKAFLTVYLGGYPTDAPIEQRRLDCSAIANEAELLLSRLAGETVRFKEIRRLALIEPHMPETVATRVVAAPPAGPRPRRRSGPIEEA